MRSVERDPRLELICLAVLHEPGSADFPQMRTVFNPNARETQKYIETLNELGWVSDFALTELGMAYLRTNVPAKLMRSHSPIAHVYRAFVGAVLLQHEVDSKTFRTLADGKAICAALAARFVKSDVSLPFESAKSLVWVAARTIIADLLTTRIPEARWSDLVALEVSKDPVLLDLFAVATGFRDLDGGFRALAARAINASSIPKTEGRWRRLSQAGFDSMAPSPSSKRQIEVDTSAAVEVVGRLARLTPTGWVPIFKAFEAFRDTRRISLADFKNILEAGARSDKLELAPLNVPSLHAEDERAQSALVMGGLTYHLVRLPK